MRQRPPSEEPCRHAKEYFAKQAVKHLTGNEYPLDGDWEIAKMGVEGEYFVFYIQLKEIDLSKESLK